MQDAPDREAILFGLAKFLDREVRPLVKGDARASFRVLVGAYLAFTCAMESADEEPDVDEELARLRELTLDTSPLPTSLREKKAKVLALEERLVSIIDDPQTSRDALDHMRPHLRKSLVAKLRVASPRFDTSQEPT
jgi:hypothetical protein